MDKKGIIMLLLYFVGLVVSVLTVFYGSLFEGYLMAVVLGGVLSFVLFLILSGTEILSSVRLRPIEKVLWLLAMVLIYNITGLFYLIVRRRWVL